MKKKIIYKDVAFGPVRRIKDFLSAPEQLVLRETNVSVTLNLSMASVDYFKGLGNKSRIPYQKLIRRLPDEASRQAA
jgi:hypothetical protein